MTDGVAGLHETDHRLCPVAVPLEVWEVLVGRGLIRLTEVGEQIPH